MKPTVLIPVSEPDDKLTTLLASLAANGFDRIVLVDDGSSDPNLPALREAEQAGCIVLRHETPRGRGRALKTGMAHCLQNGLCDAGIITAQAQGQYTTQDIELIANAMHEQSDAYVLGAGCYRSMPIKRRMGRWLERRLLAMTQGIDVRDMSTCLRGIPPKCVEPFLALSGEGNDFESNMLLSAYPMHVPIVQIDIEKEYDEALHGQQRRTLMQTLRFFWSFVLFSLSSLLATAVDYGSFIAMYAITPQDLLLCQVVSRGLSALVNYYVNCRVVFRNDSARWITLFKYAVFSAAVMFGAYGLIVVMNHVLNINVYVSKFVADNMMFFVGFSFQRDYVFGHKPIFGIKL